MPVRSNPYIGSPDVYSSRNLAPSVGAVANNIPSQLGSTIGRIIEAAMYKPQNDPRAIDAALNRQKLADEQDKNIVLRQQSDVLGDPTVSLGDIAASGLGYGHMKPEDAGKLALLAAATRGPQNGQTMDQAQTGTSLWEEAAGTPGGSTFNAHTFTDRMKPTEVVVDGKPQLTTAAEATSGHMTPVQTKEQVAGSILANLAADSAHPMTREENLAAAGAEPKQITPYTVVKPDGTTEVTSGTGALGPGKRVVSPTGSNSDLGITTPVKTEVQTNNLALKNFEDLSNRARSIAQSDPTLFGATGEVRRMSQEAAQQVKNIAPLFGSKSNDLDGVYKDAVGTMAKNGITIPGMGTYDPNLSAIRKLSLLLAYSGASALAGQNGRSVSDEDVKRFTDLMGDPTKLLSSQQDYLTGLDVADQIVGLKRKRNDETLDPKKPAATDTTQPPPKRIKIDLQGNVIP